MRVLIIGYGNPLRSDDGFGWHAAQQIESCSNFPNIEVITRQQLTPEIAETASHFDLVIFIDAACDLPPGQLRCDKIVPDTSGRGHGSSGFTHFLTPASLIAWSAELYDKFPEAYYLSVGGESFSEGETISASVQAAFEPLLARVRSIIDRK
jgi:hydrogenase maturation protease